MLWVDVLCMMSSSSYWILRLPLHSHFWPSLSSSSPHISNLTECFSALFILFFYYSNFLGNIFVSPMMDLSLLTCPGLSHCTVTSSPVALTSPVKADPKSDCQKHRKQRELPLSLYQFPRQPEWPVGWHKA